MRQGLHQLVERLVEFLDSFVLKLPRHIVDADAQFRQSLQQPVGFLDILFKAGLRFPAGSFFRIFGSDSFFMIDILIKVEGGDMIVALHKAGIFSAQTMPMVIWFSRDS